MPDLIIKALVVWGVNATLASALVNLGISVVLSAASQLLQKKSQGSDLSRELATPDSLPPYRVAYGRNGRIQGSPAPYWVVKDGILYGCIILNSRPSAGTNFALFLDRRPVGLTGNPYDFGGHSTGTATVLEGNTTVDVMHGLASAPIGDGMAAWTDDGPVTIATVGSTDLRVTLDAPAPVGGTVVTWRAVKGTIGGVAINYPFASHVNVWFGRGDQTHPPAAILEEVGDLRGINPEKFWATDRWSGRTVLWVRFVAGDIEERNTRWPSSPPMLEVQADWTKVWNPLDLTQDADDPETWKVSDNQALCLLDALRFNPIARYPLAQIALQNFTDAAVIADELVPLKSGGAERRYRVGGLIAYSDGSELSDVLKPLESAGAGTLFRSGGQIGYSPGAWEAPEVTLSECLRDQPVIFRRTRSTRDLPGAVKAVHPDPSAGWESTEEPPYPVSANWDGDDDRITAIDLGLVFSSPQAQRIQKIVAERMKLQRQLSALFPPSALKAQAGGRVAVSLLGRPTDARNGTYRVTRSHPAQWLESGGGVALQLPLDLEEDAEAVYAWNAATDEAERLDQSTVPSDPTVRQTSWVSASVDGSTIFLTCSVPGDYVYEEPITTFYPRIDSIEARFRRNQEPFWLPMANFSFEASDDLIAEGGLGATISGSSYDFGIRCRVDDRVSAWVPLYAVQVGFSLGMPTGVSLTAGAGSIEIDATAPSESACAALQIWVGTSADQELAIFYAEITCDPSDPVNTTVTGLPAGVLHHVFVRAVTENTAVGHWAATVTATPT
ncbi:phage tail protein [Pararhodobacter zhoushanensis]|uniref:Phage tail protein n=1 Tax=Pararhodobacter zhoushanensis TaxID=2479545 RepID=A0ABT3GYN9_9RHOB|nr:phage tail protein [Pararhodobacter zhoushanensis]MCW1932605.1 phage tail protein [Pararhodobacter zhoushanensis]